MSPLINHQLKIEYYSTNIAEQSDIPVESVSVRRTSLDQYDATMSAMSEIRVFGQ